MATGEQIASGKLSGIVKQIKPATEEAGFPPLTIFRQALGPHGTLVTEQKWPSMAEYEKSRTTLRQTRSVTELFEQVYPLLACSQAAVYSHGIADMSKYPLVTG